MTNDTPGHRSFCARIDSRLSAAPDAPFAVLSDGILTAADVNRGAADMAQTFASHGLVSGDRIAIFVRDDRRFLAALIASLRLGMTPILGDPAASPAEILALIDNGAPAGVLADDAAVDRVALPPDIADVRRAGDGTVRRTPSSPDVALMINTSGTTSKPKIVELTYDNLIAQLDIFSDVYGFDRETVLLNVLPLHHVDGLIRGPLSAIWFGATVCRPVEFSAQNVPALLASIATHRITHLISVPAMLRVIERSGSDLTDAFSTDAFRFVLSSADHLDAALWTRFEAAFRVPVVNAYGLSEVVCDALFAGPDAASRKIGTIGRPVGITAEVVDKAGHPVAAGQVGELALSGPTVMRGYFGAPDQTAEVLRNGAFHTGDLVRETAEGLFEFVGRKKTEIVAAGVTIHPESITATVLTMPGIAEAHAFGVPDAHRNERLVAAVVPAPGSNVEDADVWTFLRSSLAPERVPADIMLLDTLPRGPSGKIIVPELVARAAASTPVAAPTADCTVYSVAADCFNLPVEALSAGSTPFNTSGWDSLAHLTLIDELEAVFDITFSPSEIAEIACLGDAEEFVSAAQAR